MTRNQLALPIVSFYNSVSATADSAKAKSVIKEELNVKVINLRSLTRKSRLELVGAAMTFNLICPTCVQSVLNELFRTNEIGETIYDAMWEKSLKYAEDQPVCLGHAVTH